VADLAANPYLLLAAVQAVVLASLEEEKERPLPPPVTGDPALLHSPTVQRLPACLAEASTAFAASTLLRKVFGEELHGSLLDSQAAEVRRCAALSDAALVEADAWLPLIGGLG
jgi:glutamine synthetase